MAARPPLLACLAVAGVVRNPKLRWTVGFRFGPVAVFWGYVGYVMNARVSMEIVWEVDHQQQYLLAYWRGNMFQWILFKLCLVHRIVFFEGTK